MSTSRILTILCLVALLVASVAASVHKHGPSQDATCLICHVTSRASVVSICSDAGKPLSATSHDVTARAAITAIPDPPDRIRIPRAPPVQSLAL